MFDETYNISFKNFIALWAIEWCVLFILFHRHSANSLFACRVLMLITFDLLDAMTAYVPPQFLSHLLGYVNRILFPLHHPADTDPLRQRLYIMIVSVSGAFSPCSLSRYFLRADEPFPSSISRSLADRAHEQVLPRTIRLPGARSVGGDDHRTSLFLSPSLSPPILPFPPPLPPSHSLLLPGFLPWPLPLPPKHTADLLPLLQILGKGAVNTLHYNLPILAGWLIVGKVLLFFSLKRRARQGREVVIESEADH